MQEQDRVCAVLGVGPGLGTSVARRFAAEGHAVAAMARSEDSVAPGIEAIEASGGTARPFAVDATDPGSVASALARVRDQLGDPDVFVYNAGAFEIGGVLELDPEQFERLWRVNCAGAFFAAREVLPAMLERGRGTVLLTGATAGWRGKARFSGLAVGKFGLRALAQSLAREVGPQGVHVAHVVVDGQIDTPRVRSMFPGRDAGTMLSPDAIAETYWQLHRQDPTAWTLEVDLRPSVEEF